MQRATRTCTAASAAGGWLALFAPRQILQPDTFVFEEQGMVAVEVGLKEGILNTIAGGLL